MNVLSPGRRRAARAALIAVAAASATLVPLTLAPATPAHAQPSCLVATYQATTWTTGTGTGGFSATIRITNRCDVPVDGWELALTLPPGHAFVQGWSAGWSPSGNLLTATHATWNRVLGAGGSVQVGFIGSWTGAYRDPLGCLINGSPCDGSTGPNEPPVVTLTGPAGGFIGFISPCPMLFTANASDPDGAVARVEFYVNDRLVGTDGTAPYAVGLTFIPPPNPQGRWVAFARAVDTGTPPLSRDSAPVTFQIAIGDPLPESMLACRSSLALPAGTSEPIRFGLYSTTVNQATFTVTGDPRISVAPTTVMASGNLVLATVTAAPGSSGATATITATAGTIRPATMVVTVP